MRSYASKSGYLVMVVPKYSTVTIVGKYGDWYEVKYNYGYSSTYQSGYIHSSLID